MANPISYIKVHPGIGVARVGNSPDYFIGPEAPGIVPEPTTPGQPPTDNYKDENCLLKPQAARFRVYGYDANDQVVQEITTDDGTLEWSVNVQNRKAFNYDFQGKYGFDPSSLRNPNITGGTRESALIISNGGEGTAATIGGANAEPVTIEGPIFAGLDSGQLPGYFDYDDDFGGNPPTPFDRVDVTYASKDVRLATLGTDASGRLVFVGGAGEAASMTTPPIKISKVPPDPFAYNFQQPSGGLSDALGQPGVAEYQGDLYYAAQDSGGYVYVFQVEAETTTFPNLSYSLNHQVLIGSDGLAGTTSDPNSTLGTSAVSCCLATFTPPGSSSPLFIAAYNANDGSIKLGSTTDPTDSTSYTWITLPKPADGGNLYGVGLASFGGRLYVATDQHYGSDNTSDLVIASSPDVTDADSFSFASIGSDQGHSESGPTLTVWNGQLYYLYHENGPDLYIGVSADGESFDFRSVGIGSGGSPGAAPLGDDLYIAVKSGGGPALASVTDLGQVSSERAVGVSTYPGTMLSPPTVSGLRLASLGDRLVYAVIDASGRTFLAESFPGDGNSYFNNPGWYDDTCGGQIDVRVTLNGGGTLSTTDDTGLSPAEKRGWVAVAPPNYAPQINNVVSLLDLQLSLFPEQDPYTGQGPFVAGSAGSDGLYVSTDGVHYSPTPSPSGPETYVGLALAFFNGQLAYATTEYPDGQPLISFGSVGELPPLTGAASDVSFTGNQFAQPGLAVFNGRLFYSLPSGQVPMIASSSDASAGSFDFASASPSGAVLAQPGSLTALAAFNGQLFYAALDAGYQAYIASSTDGSAGSFNFQKIENPGGEGSPVSIALTVFNDALYYGYTDFNGNVHLASSQAPLDTSAFNYSPLEFQQISNVNGSGISLAAFNGKLYLSYYTEDQQIQYVTSEDGVNFTTPQTIDGSAVYETMSVLATDEPVSFYRDIYPILRTVTDYAWTNLPAFNGHGPGSMGDFLRGPFLNLLADPSLQPGSASGNDGPSARAFVYKFIRPTEIVVPPPGGQSPYVAPVPPNAIGEPPTALYPPRGSLMPHLYGNGGSPQENQVNHTQFPNQWLTLTPHQLSKFQRWVNGDFVQGTEPFPQPLDQLPVAAQPSALDFAALEPTVGGGFHPGIELTYMMGDAPWFAAPFRIAADFVTGEPIEPGDVAAYMSIPWQGDFWSCNTSWWPAIRPDIVVEDRTPTGGAPNLIPLAWFRGEGIPPKADSIPGYQEGYNLMVTDWYRFGLVTAKTGAVIEGQQVYQEVERDPTLDRDPQDSDD